jgi:membrane protease YdiL (CAAX protease family)
MLRKGHPMPKQELLSWTSLAISTTVVFFYAIINFGWPGFLPDYQSAFVKLFVNVFWIALAIELIIGFTEKQNRVDRDERDIAIEAFGIRYAYYFICVVLAVLLVHLFIAVQMESVNHRFSESTGPPVLLHLLFLTLFSRHIHQAHHHDIPVPENGLT